MTTNNPPIAAWAPSTALQKLESRHNNAPCILTDGPAEFNDVALVRLADYEALKAQCGGLVEALDGAARSLETISKLAGRDEYMQEMIEVRGYASSRAAVARSALSAHREQQGGDV